MDEKLYASLFGEYDFVSKEHLDVFLQNMNKELSIHCLVNAIKTAHNRGAFTIGETELISKSIRVLVDNENEE